MHDRDAFAFYRVDDDISVDDGRLLVKEENVSTLHRWLHTSTQDDYDWALSPEAKLEHVPNHDC